jgi:hypothetical protein
MKTAPLDGSVAMMLLQVRHAWRIEEINAAQKRVLDYDNG